MPNEDRVMENHANKDEGNQQAESIDARYQEEKTERAHQKREAQMTDSRGGVTEEHGRKQ